MLVKEYLHFQYNELKIENVIGFIERLRNQMKTFQSKVDFKNEETERKQCPKFKLDNPWESIQDCFRYINEEILPLKYDFDYIEYNE